ncbi:Wadjet anti-phage system protein JetD domain-containing protein [Salinisphaera sp. RV14]|uniref:Wadjet anti-phage system protein JetD domain-containing protein n=1 Tax=unclassified Salinisphaera TaxID=2649847 RepID=UPI003F82C2D9
MTSAGDQLLKGLLKLATKSRRIRGSSLIDRVCRTTGMSRIEVQEGLRELKKRGDISGALSDLGMPVSDIELAEQAFPVASPAEQRWRDVVSALPADDAEALAPIFTALDGWSVDDMCQLRDGLTRLRTEQRQIAHMPRFMVSAHYLMGSSKLLDSLPSRALKKFGLESMFNSPALPLIVAGSACPTTVVLVENPQSLHYAASVTEDLSITWVATYGYGLSMSGDVAGDRLARSVETENIRIIVAGGNPPPIERLMSHSSMTFWGDLDPEGIRIYDRLRSRLPQLRLSALYQPMMGLMTQTGGHPLVKATGKDGQRSGHEHAFTARYCPDRGIDQEAICSDETSIRGFAYYALDTSLPDSVLSDDTRE